MKKILDVCCGSKMFWFDKKNKDTVFMDNREFEGTLCDGRSLKVKPALENMRNLTLKNEYKIKMNG